MAEEIFVPKYMIRSTSREPSRGREQSRADALKHRPSLSLRWCSQLCAPAPCSWLCVLRSMCPALFCAPGSVYPALCAWESRMAGLKGAAVLLKGFTEHKPFHRMDETLLKHLSLVF